MSRLAVGRFAAMLPTILLLHACGGAPGVRLGLPPAEDNVSIAKVEQPPFTPSLRPFTEINGFPEYLIGPTDVLEVTLLSDVSKVEEVEVRPDGRISYSFVEDVQAAGLTPTQLDQVLTAEIAKFLRSPKIDLEVIRFNSKRVNLLGAIQSIQTESKGIISGQGRYPLKGKTTVLDLILEAGGPLPEAQMDRVKLIRAHRSYTLNIQRVLNTGEQTHNLLLQGDDIIIVPGTNQLSKKIVVLGEVRTPSVYMFPEDVSLLEALSRAGGLTESALQDDIRIIRSGAAGPEMFGVSFKRITRDADLKQNILLRNSDVVYVPRSFMGDVNDVLSKVEPLLSVLLLPATYRDLYTTGGGLRVDTGEPPTGTSEFTRALPGTASAKPVSSEDEEKEGDAEGDSAE